MVLDVALGVKQKPEPSDPSAPTWEELDAIYDWRVMDMEAMFVLEQNLSKAFPPLIQRAITTADAYERLKVFFAKDVAQVILSLANNKWTPGSGVSFQKNVEWINEQMSYVRDFKGSQDELIDIIEAVMTINSLPREWNSFKELLMVDSQEIELNHVTRSCILEERLYLGAKNNLDRGSAVLSSRRKRRDEKFSAKSNSSRKKGH